jgi:hypothetical protein
VNDTPAAVVHFLTTDDICTGMKATSAVSLTAEVYLKLFRPLVYLVKPCLRSAEVIFFSL